MPPCRFSADIFRRMNEPCGSDESLFFDRMKPFPDNLPGPPESKVLIPKRPPWSARIWSGLLVFLFRSFMHCLPGLVLVFLVWAIYGLCGSPWVKAGSVWVGGNLAVELERQSISITNEYARKLTIHQISPNKELGSFPLMPDTGGHTWILLYRFTGPEGQPCLLVNDGNNQQLDLKSGRVLDDGLFVRPKSYYQDLLYIGAWDSWRFCPSSILAEKDAKFRSEELSSGQRGRDN